MSAPPPTPPMQASPGIVPQHAVQSTTETATSPVRYGAWGVATSPQQGPAPPPRAGVSFQGMSIAPEASSVDVQFGGGEFMSFSSAGQQGGQQIASSQAQATSTVGEGQQGEAQAAFVAGSSGVSAHAQTSTSTQQYFAGYGTQDGKANANMQPQAPQRYPGFDPVATGAVGGDDKNRGKFGYGQGPQQPPQPQAQPPQVAQGGMPVSSTAPSSAQMQGNNPSGAMGVPPQLQYPANFMMPHYFPYQFQNVYYPQQYMQGGGQAAQGRSGFAGQPKSHHHTHAAPQQPPQSTNTHSSHTHHGNTMSAGAQHSQYTQGNGVSVGAEGFDYSEFAKGQAASGLPLYGNQYGAYMGGMGMDPTATYGTHTQMQSNQGSQGGKVGNKRDGAQSQEQGGYASQQPYNQQYGVPYFYHGGVMQ